MSGDLFHGLWTAAVCTAAVWAVRALGETRRRNRARSRLGGRTAADRAGPQRGRKLPALPALPAGTRRWVPAVAGALLGWAMVGWPVGWAVGAAAGYGLGRWRRLPRPGSAGGGAAEGLPLAADLLAACLSAGAGPREAAEAVGGSLGGPVGGRLRWTAAELALGGDPAEAWGRLGEVPGAQPLARCLERASASGAPAAVPVARLAAGLRADGARAAAARAQRAQVLITAPVGLCFLPAFLAVGVAPVVIGLAARLL
ncbi:type II secretion protein F [Streptomyces sp. CC53]|nr:type II secretion protein F [Streptomyces sp. CC53]